MVQGCKAAITMILDKIDSFDIMMYSIYCSERLETIATNQKGLLGQPRAWFAIRRMTRPMDARAS